MKGAQFQTTINSVGYRALSIVGALRNIICGETGAFITVAQIATISNCYTAHNMLRCLCVHKYFCRGTGASCIHH